MVQNCGTPPGWGLATGTGRGRPPSLGTARHWSSQTPSAADPAACLAWPPVLRSVAVAAEKKNENRMAAGRKHPCGSLALGNVDLLNTAHCSKQINKKSNLWTLKQWPALHLFQGGTQSAWFPTPSPNHCPFFLLQKRPCPEGAITTVICKSLRKRLIRVQRTKPQPAAS